LCRLTKILRDSAKYLKRVARKVKRDRRAPRPKGLRHKSRPGGQAPHRPRPTPGLKGRRPRWPRRTQPVRTAGAL